MPVRASLSQPYAEDSHTMEPRSDRLRLPLLPRAVLLAGAAPQRAHAFVDYRLHPDWFSHTALMALRAADLEADPDYAPWGLRAMVHDGRMIGHLGFHTRPGPDYLAPWAPAGVEIGYTVYAPYRQHGLGREAVACLLSWAAREHGVHQFVASVSPDNRASLALVHSLGFVPVGEHHDPVDGDEIIHVLDYAAPQA